MASFLKETEIEFDVVCSKCGNYLDTIEKQRGTSYELQVDLCETCKEEIEAEIKDRDEQIEKLVEEYDEKISDLYDEIEALKTELTYNKIKNKEEECTSLIST